MPSPNAIFWAKTANGSTSTHCSKAAPSPAPTSSLATDICQAFTPCRAAAATSIPATGSATSATSKFNRDRSNFAIGTPPKSKLQVVAVLFFQRLQAFTPTSSYFAPAKTSSKKGVVGVAPIKQEHINPEPTSQLKKGIQNEQAFEIEPTTVRRPNPS